MLFLRCYLMLVFVKSDDSLEFVRGPSGPLVAPLGGSVVLPCYVETPLVKKLIETVKVVWKRTDLEELVHLYQDGESRPEEQHKDYRDRAHFFTDQIQHGNFSLYLENVSAEDNGVYICKVYSKQTADKTLAELKVVERLLVSGSDESISASVGEDVTLNCSVDSHITPEHIEEVSWRKTDEDGDILVLLYQNNETLSDSSDERYKGRVEFFTDETPKGNFSLRLKRVRTEDRGVYMCLVFAGGTSANATVVLEQLGFSVLHTMVLILCVFAPGFALLNYRLVHSRSDDRDTRHCLYLCLSPNIIMLLASVIWCVTEGSLYETVCCCMFYILEPLRLIWVSSYATAFPEKIKLPHADHAAFMVVMYSVLLAEHFKNITPVIRAATFGLVILMCLVFIKPLVELVKEKLLCCTRIYSKIQSFVAACSFSFLPSLQLTLLLYTHFGSGAEYIFAVLSVLPGLHLVFIFCGVTCCQNKCCLNFLTKSISIMVIVMSAVMAFSYITLLRNEKGGAGLICVAGLVQGLWVLAFSEVPVCCPNFQKRKMLFLFGSAGLVLVNSVALMTELIMKAIKGARLLGDLRIALLPSEALFTTVLLVLSSVSPRKPVSTDSQEDSQKSSDFNGTPATKYTSTDLNQKTENSHEMESLGKVAGNSEEEEEEIC